MQRPCRPICWNSRSNPKKARKIGRSQQARCGRQNCASVQSRCIPVTHGMPPYYLFAIPPEDTHIPSHRTDVGTVLLADLTGARTCVFIRDEQGLCTDDPKKNPQAEFIPEIGARDLMQRDLEDLIIERPCLEILQHSEVVKKFRSSTACRKASSAVHGTVKRPGRRSIASNHSGPEKFLRGNFPAGCRGTVAPQFVQHGDKRG